MLTRTSLHLKVKFNPYASFMGKKGITTTVTSRAREDKISASRRRQEEQIVLPKTLKSGRYDAKVTIAQQVAEEQEKREDLAGKVDARFSQRISDFRQIQDPDAMSKIFGESKHTQKVRLREWQRQFEKENENVWLPYERTNFFLKYFMPNWFVKMMVQARDRGGFSGRSFGILFALVLSFYFFIPRLMYGTPDEKIRMESIR